MRQNCLPQVVNRWISHRITIVATAAITQALAIHHSDVSSSLPQSNVGVNILSIWEKYLGNLVAAPWDASIPGRERVEPPFSVADKLQVTAMELLNRAAVTHA